MNQSDARSRRAAAVNWLIAFAGADDLLAVDPMNDLGAIDRARYERRLGLLPGSLTIGRFVHEFSGWNGTEVGERLLDEAYLGEMFRDERVISQQIASVDAPVADDLRARFGRFLSDVGLEAYQVLMLSGSTVVASVFEAWGAIAPDLRRPPGSVDVTRFGLAIIGRGQAGHKDFEPWLQLIRLAGKHRGPTPLTMPSSNISGIVEYLWSQRAPIRRYVEEWQKQP